MRGAMAGLKTQNRGPWVRTFMKGADGSMRPLNSASAGLMPLSTIAILTPWPVEPCCHAVIAPELTAPFDR